MNAPKPDEIPLAVGTLLAAACWTWLVFRWRRGMPVLPLAWRRQVPWDGLAALGGALLLLVIGPVIEVAVVRALGVTPDVVDAAAHDSDHLVVRLVRDRPGVMTIAVCLAAVVVAAPLVEEFFFRVVLQGWLERVEGHWRRRRAPRWFRGVLPVLMSSLFFAAVHARTSHGQLNPDYLLCLIGASAVYNLLFLAAALVVLRGACGATWRDLGASCSWPELRRDVIQGLVAFVAVFGPVYIVQGVAKTRLPATIAADPAGIFALALALGVLYFRTHRLLPSLVLHMAFNAASMTLLLLSV